MTTPTTTTPANLNELLSAIKAGRYDEREMADLPSFGGVEPHDTEGVWSWDETRLLVSTGNAESYKIIPRADRFGVSVDNGQHTVDPDDLTDEQIERHHDALISMMDYQARELAHAAAAPCTKRAFLHSYLQRAPADLVIG